MSHTFTFETGINITVYVSELRKSIEPIHVEHNVLDARHSILQDMGTKSPRKDFQFHLYGQGAMDYLDNCVASGSPFYYTGDRGTIEYYYVPMAWTYDRVQALNYPDNWFKCTMSAMYLDNLDYYQCSEAPPLGPFIVGTSRVRDGSYIS